MDQWTDVKYEKRKIEYTQLQLNLWKDVEQEIGKEQIRYRKKERKKKGSCKKKRYKQKRKR